MTFTNIQEKHLRAKLNIIQSIEMSTHTHKNKKAGRGRILGKSSKLESGTTDTLKFRDFFQVLRKTNTEFPFSRKSRKNKRRKF